MPTFQQQRPWRHGLSDLAYAVVEAYSWQWPLQTELVSTCVKLRGGPWVTWVDIGQLVIRLWDKSIFILQVWFGNSLTTGEAVSMASLSWLSLTFLFNHVGSASIVKHKLCTKLNSPKCPPALPLTNSFLGMNKTIWWKVGQDVLCQGIHKNGNFKELTPNTVRI